MFRTRVLASALVLLTLAFATTPATAAWPHEPNVGGLPVCTATQHQTSPRIIADGAGGTIVAWEDARVGGIIDIYAQRISAAGVPLWTADGVVVCAAAGNQLDPRLVSDGAGGAIITWQDGRVTGDDIYAQRINTAGVPQWTANGVAVCTATGYQYAPTIAPDNAGGAIITWYDARITGPDIYAQRISAAGAATWTANGVVLCNAVSSQLAPEIVADGSGGAIVAWSDLRSGTYDIYAQCISRFGVTAWTANGVAVCSAVQSQYYPKLVPDGAGGAIVTWYDWRTGAYDIYAQRVTATGSLDWTTDGVAVCTATGEQTEPGIVSDGVGGAIVCWTDTRNGSKDIYAQRISGAGSSQWMANGVPLCASTGDQSNPVIAPDGLSGAVVAWNDARVLTSNDVYAQRVSATGIYQWLGNGVAVSTAPWSQQYPAILTDGAGGAVIAWSDSRSTTSYDIYAQRVERFGQLGNPEPVITGVKDVKNDQGGFVKVSWSASYLDADPGYGITDYRIWRSVPQAALTARALLARGATRDADDAAAGGRYLVRPYASTDYAWELVGTQASAILPGYSVTAATTSDSIAGSNPRTAFMIEARANTSVSTDRWFSAPDSGYSVDNLPPGSPAPFTGQYSGGIAKLHWNRNTETDLAGYRLYRGTSPAFTPGPGNLVSAQPDTGYTDRTGTPYVYKLTAVDVHGNESPVATLVPGGTTGVGGPGPHALSLSTPSPNPARGGTALDYTLSRAGSVRLSVFDAAGRRVLVLREGELAAGPHRESFAMRDEAGRDLASGLYLVRLEAEGRVLTRRLVAIR